MAHPAVDWAQEKKLIEWTGSGFDQFIALRVDRVEDFQSGADIAQARRGSVATKKNSSAFCPGIWRQIMNAICQSYGKICAN